MKQYFLLKPSIEGNFKRTIDEPLILRTILGAIDGRTISTTYLMNDMIGL